MAPKGRRPVTQKQPVPVRRPDISKYFPVYKKAPERALEPR